jgi:hypothetical protein
MRRSWDRSKDIGTLDRYMYIYGLVLLAIYKDRVESQGRDLRSLYMDLYTSLYIRTDWSHEIGTLK